MTAWQAWTVAIGGPGVSGLLMWRIVNDMQEASRLAALEIRVEYLEKQTTKMLEILLGLLQASGVQ